MPKRSSCNTGATYHCRPTRASRDGSQGRRRSVVDANRGRIVLDHELVGGPSVDPASVVYVAGPTVRNQQQTGGHGIDIGKGGGDCPVPYIESTRQVPVDSATH